MKGTMHSLSQRLSANPPADCRELNLWWARQKKTLPAVVCHRSRDGKNESREIRYDTCSKTKGLVVLDVQGG